MKILMTTDCVGGVWSYALQLARGLQSYGARIGIAVMGRALTSEQRAQFSELPHVTVYESTFRLEWMDRPELDLEAAADWLLDIASEFRPDLVHLNEYVYGSLDWNCPVLMVGHSCVLSWHRDVRGCDAGPEWSAYRDRVRRGLAAADVVAAPSPGMLSRLERHYGPLPCAVVIPNGIALLRREATVKEPFVFAAGRLWDDAKNIRLLDSISERLSWPVRVAGETRSPEAGTVEQPISKSPRPRCGGEGAFSGLHFLGTIPAQEMRALFARAPIFAHPAKYEPFGLTPLEAAICGCALVLSDIDTLREIWGDAPLYASPHDPEQWLTQLQKLIDDTELRQQVAECCARRASRYTARSMAHRYFREYEGLLFSRAAKPSLVETA